MTSVADPTTPKEWEDFVQTKLSTPEAGIQAVKDGTLAKAIAGYGAAYRDEKNREMADLKAQVTEQTQKTVHDLLKKNDQDAGNAEYRLNLVASARARGKKTRQYYNDQAIGAGLDGLYGSLGEFMQACHTDPRRLQGEQAEKHQKLVAYSSNVPDQGGILIPEEFRSDIFTGPALEQAIVRPNATVVPMKSSKLKYPAIDFTTEVGEVWGGIIFYWMDEEGTIPDTSAGFAALELNAHRLAGAALVPNDLMKDVGALTTWLMTNLPKGCLNEEDKAFMKGDGVKKPLGGLHGDNPALIAVAAEVGQTSGISWNNILAMYARFLPDSFDNGQWVAAPNTIPELYTLAVPVGTGGSAVMIGDGTQSAAVSPQRQILGMPLRISRKVPAGLNTQGDISLVDWSTYLIGDTQDVRVESSEHYKFLEDKTAFKVVERVDGQPQLLSALTPEYGGDTLSSFVQLATRS
jgi:HK97 family phage major capsid protein